ncbi:MAG: SCO family protein [Rhizobiales bacterium]|nr:SCO family protein [Hyphomicrobiales bacterium]MBI3674746.1 SCO family protein [Hyphomicrobiales bacterium]
MPSRTQISRRAYSHSLEELSQGFISEAKYFQSVDTEATGFTLQDTGGRAVSLADFGGKVVVLNFVYINCPDFCPLQSEKIAEIQKMVNITPMKTQVEFISISTDPKRDFGRALTDYGDNHGLDPVNWVFPTAAPGQPEDSTRQLAASYGLQFKLAADGEQMHGVVTNVISQDGRLVARFHSLKFESLNLVKFINALTNDPHPGSSRPGLWARLKAWF